MLALERVDELWMHGGDLSAPRRRKAMFFWSRRGT
jgi:hypothetical protein